MMQKIKDQVIISLMLILIFLTSYNIYIQSSRDQDNYSQSFSEKDYQSTIKISGKILEQAKIVNNSVQFKAKSNTFIYNIICETDNLDFCNKLSKDSNVKIEGRINEKLTKKGILYVSATFIETENVLIFKIK